MSEVLQQSTPTRKPTRPSNPPINKKKLCKVDKKEVESLCEAFDAMAIEVLPPHGRYGRGGEKGNPRHCACRRADLPRGGAVAAKGTRHRR